jgi:hypothetical protein
MSFTVKDFHDLIRLLEERPEWRSELRRFLLPDEMLEVPRLVRELAEAQRRTEERLEGLAARVEQLAEAQRRTEERVEQLAEAQRRTEERVEQLAEAQRRTEAGVEELRAAHVRMEGALERLTAQVRLLTNETAQLKGSDLERRYRERAPAYFARLMRRIHALSSEEIAALVDDAEERGELSEAERDELFDVDVVVRGLSRDDGAEAYLAVEVSGGVGRYDVERALRRAELLQRLTGTRTIPVVAGQAITDEGERLARQLRVKQVLDGRVSG